jgi:hypothetical protein
VVVDLVVLQVQAPQQLEQQDKIQYLEARVNP